MDRCLPDIEKKWPTRVLLAAAYVELDVDGTRGSQEVEVQLQIIPVPRCRSRTGALIIASAWRPWTIYDVSRTNPTLSLQYYSTL